MRTPADTGWGDPRDLDYSDMTRVEIWPGHTVSLRNDDVGTVMTELIHRLRAAGWTGPDAQLDEWGYNARLKRWAEAAGQEWATAPLSSVSDHSWGTALDLDTAANPMYADAPANPQAHTTMPVAACPGIAAALGLEWGGSWTEPWDPQHWQVAATPAELHEIAERIRAVGYTEEDDMFSDDDRAALDKLTAQADKYFGLLAQDHHLLLKVLAPGQAKLAAQVATLAAAQGGTVDPAALQVIADAAAAKAVEGLTVTITHGQDG